MDANVGITAVIIDIAITIHEERGDPILTPWKRPHATHRISPSLSLSLLSLSRAWLISFKWEKWPSRRKILAETHVIPLPPEDSCTHHNYWNTTKPFHFFFLSFSFSSLHLLIVDPYQRRRRSITMGKILILMALCILPALVSARPLRSNFIVQGRVYCDTCRAGFETTASTYMHGRFLISFYSSSSSHYYLYIEFFVKLTWQRFNMRRVIVRLEVGFWKLGH